MIMNLWLLGLILGSLLQNTRSLRYSQSETISWEATNVFCISSSAVPFPSFHSDAHEIELKFLLERTVRFLL